MVQPRRGHHLHHVLRAVLAPRDAPAAGLALLWLLGSTNNDIPVIGTHGMPSFPKAGSTDAGAATHRCNLVKVLFNNFIFPNKL